jgi:hypothetical protein
MPFSPFQVFFCYFAPATPTNRESITLENYVNFYVLVFAFLIPRISTTFHRLTTFHAWLDGLPQSSFKGCCEKYKPLRGER